jgi:hypothetical protein
MGDPNMQLEKIDHLDVLCLPPMKLVGLREGVVEVGLENREAVVHPADRGEVKVSGSVASKP